MSAATSNSPAAPSNAPIDRRTAWKIVASVVGGIAVVGGVFYASMTQDMQLYKMVDEVMVAPAQFQGKRLQVHGYVVEKSILNKSGTLEYQFKLETRAPRPHAVITASYKGLVPDTFKSGAEVVASGTLTPDNQLAATAVSAKCPSKYEAKEPSLYKANEGAYQAPGATTTARNP
jgi:cytochrome c-type biogenesis protein CcmE